MPRDSNGNYTLPAGNPVISGSVIASTWANTTLADIGTAMTDSLDRSGFGGMLAALKLIDGTIGAPALSWTTDGNSGWYRAGVGDYRFSIGSADVIRLGTNRQVTISAPAAGTALTINAFAAAAGLAINGATGSQGFLTITDGQTGTRQWRIGVGNAAVGALDIADLTRGVSVITINSSGAVAIPAPVAGSTLTLTSLAGVPAMAVNMADGHAAMQVNTAAATQCAAFLLNQTGQGQAAIYQPAASGDLRIQTGGANDRIIITNVGAVSISASATAGTVALTVNSAATATAVVINQVSNQNAITITDGTISQSWGNNATNGYVGTNTAQAFALVTNASSRVSVSSAGAVTINQPGSAVAHTINMAAVDIGLAIVSANGVTSNTDVQISRTSSTANNVGKGPNLRLGDTGGSTFTMIQQSGGQTEFWQFNSGAWNQLAAWNSSRALSLTAAGSGTTLTVNQNGATPGCIVTGGTNPLFQATDGTVLANLQVATASSIGLVGTSSNHGFNVRTNNIDRITISNAGAVQNFETNFGASSVKNTATYDTGTFTGTFTGMTAATTGTCTWARAGNLVTLTFPSAGHGTSNTTAFTMTGLPSSIQPVSLNQTVSISSVSGVQDNTSFVDCGAQINAASGTITFVTGTGASGWTASGTKGFTTPTSITYSLV